MDPETQKYIYHSDLFNAAGKAMMNFGPINAIHQHLCAFHPYAHDRTRQLEAHHFCTHLSPDLHQCIIYDSDKHDARLIGIEYIVSEKIFKTLSPDEKKYWHSHQYEVESGMLQLQAKNIVPGSVVGIVEKPAMLELQQTYGKTIHTWTIDQTPELPLGPPQLMMSYTEPGQADQSLIIARDDRFGLNTDDQGDLRKTYLPQYVKTEGSDSWELTGKAIVFDPVEVDIKQ